MVSPLSALHVAQMRPRCASTMERLMASPSPSPSGLVLTKVSKIVATLAASTPTPRSHTVIATRPGSRGEVLTVTLRGGATVAIACSAFQQIEDDLLELDAVAAHGRQVVGQRQLDRGAAPHRIARDELDDLGDELVEVDRLVL